MQISAHVACDSYNSAGNRLTTFILTYPRFIHAQFMTHRVFSRNAASSRAIPFEKSLEVVQKEGVIPVQFGKNKRGMQASEEIANPEQAAQIWEAAKNAAIENAKALAKLGVHKQIVNRLLEPFNWITVICTATEYGNFFYQRVDEAAQPEIQELAQVMLTAYKASKPSFLPDGKYHLPLLTEEDFRICGETATLHSDTQKDFDAKMLDYTIQLSVAKCARVSFTKHDEELTLENGMRLYAHLVEHGHWSPFEHIAAATPNAPQTSNFVGFTQHRKNAEFVGRENILYPVFDYLRGSK